MANDAQIERLQAPRAGSSHVAIRFDVERDTAITAQWNVDRTHLIVSFGDHRCGLRILFRPHAARRLQAALAEIGSDADAYVCA